MRRSTLSQSRTLCIGMDVQKDAIAVASVAYAPGAAVPSLSSLGPRQRDIDPLGRQRQAKATHLLCVYAAGPCGFRLSRSLRRQGSACGVMAPALLPQTPGDRSPTDRRDAGPLARLGRLGALTPSRD